MNRAMWILIVAFAFALLIKGIVPAFTTIGTDFTNYYASSYVLIHQPHDSFRLYDSAWFSKLAQSLGGPEGAVFQPFPPPTALLLVPLTIFDLRTAKSIWTLMNLCIASCLVIVVARISALSIPRIVLVLLASGWALINTFALGQVYLLMTLCLALSLYFYLQRKDHLSGLLAGLFVPIKYFPLALVFVFVLERRWHAATGAAVSALAILFLSMISLGPEVHRVFIDSVLFQHLDGEMINPFSVSYQSWNSLLRSVFVKDQLLNPNPLVDWPIGFLISRAAALLALSWILFRSIYQRSRHDSQTIFFIAISFLFALLVAPATATYHFLVLMIPISMLISRLLDTKQFVLLAFTLVLYCGVGLVPAGALDQLAFSGAWKLLMYPRLYLLTALFLTLAWMPDHQQLPASTFSVKE